MCVSRILARYGITGIGAGLFLVFVVFVLPFDSFDDRARDIDGPIPVVFHAQTLDLAATLQDDALLAREEIERPGRPPPTYSNFPPECGSKYYYFDGMIDLQVCTQCGNRFT
jgi:hypothetical protein